MLLDYLLQPNQLQQKRLLKKSQPVNLKSVTDCQLIALVGGGGKTTCAFTLAQQAKSKGLRVLITTSTKMYLPDPSLCDGFIDTSAITKENRDNDSYDYHIESADSGSLVLEQGVDPLSASRLNDTDHSLNTDNSINLTMGQHALPSARQLHPTGLLIFAYHGLVNSCDPQQKTKVNGLSKHEISSIKASGQFDIIFVEADGARRLPIKAPSRHEPCIPSDVDIVIAVTGCEVISQPISAELIHRWNEFTQVTGCKAGDVMDQQILGRLIAHPDGMFKQVPADCRRIWLINKLDLTSNYDDIKSLSSDLLARNGSLDGVCLASMQSAAPIFDLQLR
ncbi:putative selenium-dependent hydroxylase accessory protein YqeC [Shewanella eurypsychrophilus]|uniref:Selenium-dependent hydroxylase accessory protein YqeC n=1 Tax=Shewanella eurypsychrophilus TaxID=2593656 RepID=A0ABX6V670_9GAMM|nr:MULTISPECIES: selenium cofactor biosynthesis protein YqeC [Shewanella]QFU22735.1 putative selenium-dependent hydroxylase accessory protein YqeC [Shewanella sp. YLB-09]QPG58024.1 putative selenium-dependent hydroxylase accessory protein YqeC [Shewanella eurypsychrophilus]